MFRGSGFVLRVSGFVFWGAGLIEDGGRRLKHDAAPGKTRHEAPDPALQTPHYFLRVYTISTSFTPSSGMSGKPS